MSNLSDSIKSGAIDQLKTTNELLEQQVLELKGVVSSQKSRIRMLDRELNLFRDSNLGDFTEKAKAWDDLEALVHHQSKNKYRTWLFNGKARFDDGEHEYVYLAGREGKLSDGWDLKEAVSNALESIKGK